MPRQETGAAVLWLAVGSAPTAHPRTNRAAVPRRTQANDVGSLERSFTQQPAERDADPWRELGAQFPIRHPDVVLGLQVQPGPRLHAEEHPANRSVLRTWACFELLVGVHDLDAVRATRLPDEADPPLVVGANAVLTVAVGVQRLKRVARRDTRAGEFGGPVRAGFRGCRLSLGRSSKSCSRGRRAATRRLFAGVRIQDQGSDAHLLLGGSHKGD